MAASMRIILAAVTLAASATPVLAEFPINMLASFDGADGTGPRAPLTLSGDGSTLYGTTFLGGDSGNGTVFSVPTAGGEPTVLTMFEGTDGASPSSPVIISGNALFGTTGFGGPTADGEIFSLPLTGGEPTVLVAFNYSVGYTPVSGVMLYGSTLYGALASGGAGSLKWGAVFSVPATGGTPTLLGSFDETNGQDPWGIPTLSADGKTLYGTTLDAGGSTNGEVYCVPITGGTVSVLASFNGLNGQGPQGTLVLLGDALYGTTSGGGLYGEGTVFSVPVTGGAPTVLASFDGTHGASPLAGLTLSADGSTLYGTTKYGGDNGDGAVFSLPIGGGIPTLVASFDGADGANPFAGVTLSADGNTLYGTTAYGGDDGDGTAFSISLNAPEPAGTGLLALGAISLCVRRKKRCRA